MLAAALMLVAAPAALAHGDEHDVQRVAAGAAGSYDVTVWTEGTPTADGLLTLSVSVSPTDPATTVTGVRLTATGSGGDAQTVKATAVTDADRWEAAIPTSPDRATHITVDVIGGDAGGRLAFAYVAPGSSWWMKLIVVAALTHGAACAVWLFGRRHRVLRGLTAPVTATT